MWNKVASCSKLKNTVFSRTLSTLMEVILWYEQTRNMIATALHRGVWQRDDSSDRTRGPPAGRIEDGDALSLWHFVRRQSVYDRGSGHWMHPRADRLEHLVRLRIVPRIRLPRRDVVGGLNGFLRRWGFVSRELLRLRRVEPCALLECRLLERVHRRFRQPHVRNSVDDDAAADAWDVLAHHPPPQKQHRHLREHRDDPEHQQQRSLGNESLNERYAAWHNACRAIPRALSRILT